MHGKTLSLIAVQFYKCVAFDYAMIQNIGRIKSNHLFNFNIFNALCLHRFAEWIGNVKSISTKGIQVLVTCLHAQHY